ncbi:MAG: hypothetical protein MN733_03915 [Nitrososphaera sp.]|nr:hypothetical protein [Nitrososphaera sp.]
MFKTFIKSCFSELAQKTPNDVKSRFAMLWALFASKVVRLKSGAIQLSWRELSSELADVANEWHHCNFTTDAFLKSYNHKKKFGEDAEFDNVIKQVSSHPDFLGIFVIQQSRVASGSVVLGFAETNFLTGETTYFRQRYEHGRQAGDKVQISGTEYERLCYGN